MSKYNYVMSYINPDTDGIACSIAMAKLLSNKKEKWIPIILGGIGEKTIFILRELGIPFPERNLLLDKAEKIVLVDTHHKTQLPERFPYNNVIAIIDHHPNGDEDLFPYAKIINKKIGAAASFVANMYFENEIKDKSVLQLLAFAILSNTLNFSAPSSTDYDRIIFNKINAIAPISVDLINGMFEQRSLILKADIYTAICADFKVFDTKKGKVGISQIEAYNLESMIDISCYADTLNQIAIEKNIKFCLFNGVDIKSKRSLVIAAKQQSRELLCSIFQLKECREYQIFNRMLLRKTDFVPLLND